MFEGWSDERPQRLILNDPREVRSLPWADQASWPSFIRGLQRPASVSRRTSFESGWIGYVSYDAAATTEGARPRVSHPPEPAAWFARHEGGHRQIDGTLRSFGLAAALQPAVTIGHAGDSQPSHIDDSLDGQFSTAIATIRESIAAGDVYQVNLTRAFSVAQRAEPVDLYLSLTGDDPPAESAFLRGDSWCVASASPEVLLIHDTVNGRSESRPIKGTVDSRAQTGRELLASAKDASEHLMIVDLVRNDLGRVAAPGSVRVSAFRVLRRAGAALHLESTVSCSTEGRNVAELLEVLMPGGSITGAPKRAAVAAIRQLEPVPRGVYTGAIGWIDDGGSARFSVAIRTAVVTAEAVRYHAGGGIVWDSSAESEDRESRLKAEAFLRWAARR